MGHRIADLNERGFASAVCRRSTGRGRRRLTSPEADVQDVPEDLAPHAGRDLFEQGELLARAFLTGAISRPRAASCSISGGGMSGQAAVTQIRS
jgi:hypothetical protein